MPTINSESYFSDLPKVEIQRSIFRMPFSHKTAFNVGEVVPLACIEILPGDTFKVRSSVVARLQTLLTPIMDNVNLELSAWFVPMRQVWDHTAQFFGENTSGPWTMEQVKYRIPYLKYPEPDSDPSTGWKEGTIADYMGIPLKVNFNNVPDVSDANFPSVLPFRGYAKIINEFWRDQNLQQPVVIHTDDVVRTGSNGDNYITDLELGGKPFIAARYHDMFSSSLPAPQKSESISIFGNPINNPTYAPVIARGQVPSGSTEPLLFARSSSTSYPRWVNAGEESSTNQNYLTIGNYSSTVTPYNLWTNLNIPEATITQLRLAFQLQRYYEKSARGGTRYREYLQEFFGVTNGDLRMFVPEYLGGKRIPLSIHQVANTSQSADGDLGDLGAMSNTSDVDDLFYHSFTEHGYLYVLGVVRYPNTYAQGLERMWSRRDVLEFYNPTFAHLSEQPIYKRQIFLEGSGADAANHADEVWGYNEAWCEYRQIPSRVSSSMRPESSQSLASWHLADDYSETPYLSSDWLKTNKKTVDRVLAVGSDTAKQVFVDFYLDIEATRPMPVHSIPGLADHF